VVPDYAKGARAPRLGVIANHNTNLLNEVSPSSGYRASRDCPNCLLPRLLTTKPAAETRIRPTAGQTAEHSPSHRAWLRLDAGRGNVMLRFRVCRYGATVTSYCRLVQVVVCWTMARLGANPGERYENLAKWTNPICTNGRLVILGISMTGSACPGLISDCKVEKTKFGGYIVNG